MQDRNVRRPQDRQVRSIAKNRPTRRIAFVSLHPMGAGAAASTHIHGIAAGLEDHGWAVSITAVQHGTGPVSLPRRVIGWLAAQGRAVPALLRSDVLYLRSHPAALPLVAVARLMRLPILVEVNGPDEDYLAAWPQLRRAPWLVSRSVGRQLRAASAVITVTEGLARWVTSRSGGRPCVVIPNGVDPARFTAETARSLNGHPYVIFIGALAPWQGITELLAAASAPQWPADVQLLVVGDGAAAPRVRAAAERHPQTIRWLGHVDPGRVPDLLAGAVAALVLSKDRRGTGVSPLKLYEAMAAGTPVIVADVKEAADTVRDADCGVIVPADDARAIAAAVAGLVADPQSARAMGRRGRASVVEKHSWSARAADVNKLLSTVWHGRHAAKGVRAPSP